MAVGPNNPNNTVTMTPTVAVAARRFMQPNGEQCTVAGQLAFGVSPEAIAAGANGPCDIGGICTVEAGAPIALDRGPAGYPNTYAYVMTDANGRAILWTAGNAVAGIINVAATVATQQLSVFMCPNDSPILPE